jgi:hypothetical protein
VPTLTKGAKSLKMVIEVGFVTFVHSSKGTCVVNVCVVLCNSLSIYIFSLYIYMCVYIYIYKHTNMKIVSNKTINP